MVLQSLLGSFFIQLHQALQLNEFLQYSNVFLPCSSSFLHYSEFPQISERRYVTVIYIMDPAFHLPATGPYLGRTPNFEYIFLSDSTWNSKSSAGRRWSGQAGE